MTLKKAHIATALPRFQACLECKKRKIRCDAVRPCCGSCTRTARARGLAPSPCHYQEDLPSHTHGHSHTPSRSNSVSKQSVNASHLATPSPPPQESQQQYYQQQQLSHLSSSHNLISSHDLLNPLVHSPAESHDFQSDHSHDSDNDHQSAVSYGSVPSSYMTNSSSSSLDDYSNSMSNPSSISCDNAQSKDDEVIILETRVASLETLVTLQMNCIAALRAEVAYTKAQLMSTIPSSIPQPSEPNLNLWRDPKLPLQNFSSLDSITLPAIGLSQSQLNSMSSSNSQQQLSQLLLQYQAQQQSSSQQQSQQQPSSQSNSNSNSRSSSQGGEAGFSMDDLRSITSSATSEQLSSAGLVLDWMDSADGFNSSTAMNCDPKALYSDLGYSKYS